MLSLKKHVPASLAWNEKPFTLFEVVNSGPDYCVHKYWIVVFKEDAPYPDIADHPQPKMPS